jgi:hypothetical protein
MAPPSSRKPPFDVPKGLSPINNLRLEQTSLIEFFELNRQDFFDVMSARYFDIINLPDPGAIADAKTGFASFCDLMTQYFLAPPSETVVSTRDEKGRNVNFFGEAILKHVGKSNLTAQQLYAYDGVEKYPWIGKLVDIFVRHVAIDCFGRALPLQEDIDILKARTRIKALLEGTRKLKFVPPGRIL